MLPRYGIRLRRIAYGIGHNIDCAIARVGNQAFVQIAAGGGYEGGGRTPTPLSIWYGICSRIRAKEKVIHKMHFSPWQGVIYVLYLGMFDEIVDIWNEEEIEEARTRKLLDKICEGVEIPSDEEVEETLDWQDG